MLTFMAATQLDTLISQLGVARYRFGHREAASVLSLLTRLDKARFSDPLLLIRFHEALLFCRAFPQSPAVLAATERILLRFHKRVRALRKSGTDMEEFDSFEYSGIAGTQMEDTLSFDVARWLLSRMPEAVEIAWENYEPGRELGNIGPRFIPFLADDACVEADTPWRKWLEEARPTAPKGEPAHSASWLLQCFEKLCLPAQQKAELYESLRVPLTWNLGNSSLTRTRNRKVVTKVFYHDQPLISRSEVSFKTELARRPPKLTRISRKRGEEVVELIREVMLVRYRELYGTTLADPQSVVNADVGRGVRIYLWNLPPDRRLPLRAYVAGLTLKNGVPINYIEAIGLCEWMEVGFNTFYTFRGGEAGWIYAQVLRCLCHMMGTTCVSVYPYQLGDDNEEAIASGAFWFYRKLGFRPGRADLRELVAREETEIAADPKYRTPAKTLKRLAAGHVFYELPGAEVGAWDKFSARNIGLRVTKRMSREFGGDIRNMADDSKDFLERALSVRTSSWPPLEKAAFENFAMILASAGDLHNWRKEEKQQLVQVIRAKSKPDEMRYLHLMQQHDKLRLALLKAGDVSKL